MRSLEGVFAVQKLVKPKMATLGVFLCFLMTSSKIGDPNYKVLYIVRCRIQLATSCPNFIEIGGEEKLGGPLDQKGGPKMSQPIILTRRLPRASSGDYSASSSAQEGLNRQPSNSYVMTNPSELLLAYSLVMIEVQVGILIKLLLLLAFAEELFECV